MTTIDDDGDDADNDNDDDDDDDDDDDADDEDGDAAADDDDDDDDDCSRSQSVRMTQPMLIAASTIPDLWFVCNLGRGLCITAGSVHGDVLPTND